MKTVSIITAEMRGINGANRVTEKLIAGKDYFAAKNIKLGCLYTDSFVVECDNYVSMLGTYSDSYLKKRSIIEILKKLPLYKTRFIQAILQKRVIQYSKLAVDRYFSNDDGAECIIFQDVFCAYHYLRSPNKKKNVKTMLITHTDEDPLEHYLINRPQLKGSKTEKLIREIYRFVFCTVDKTISICPQAKNYIDNTYGIDAACIINGIEDTNYTRSIEEIASSYPINIIELGTVTYRKGQDLIVDALSKMKEEELDKICIHIVGKGDLLEPLKAQAEKANIEKSIIFHGEIKEVANMLAQMDAMVLPSRADTVPISIIEGLRAGLPIFATSHGEVPNMIKGCGKLIQSEVDNIVGLFRDIIADPKELKKYAKLSRDKYERDYNLESMINKYAQEIEKL